VYEYGFTPNPTKTFHRGQTDYFLHKRTRPMANWDTPKSTGEKIGKVIDVRGNAIHLQLQHGITLHNGDGLCFGDKGFAINKIDGDWIYPNIRISDINNRILGVILYRNLDNDFLHSLKAERRIPVDICFETTELGYRLTVGDLSAEFSAEHQPANNPERALQTINQQLSKLGDTHFVAKTITIIANNQTCLNTFPYFIPISTLNQWRREITKL
jgi:putative protease